MPPECHYHHHDDEQCSTDLLMPECATDWLVADKDAKRYCNETVLVSDIEKWSVIHPVI